MPKKKPANKKNKTPTDKELLKMVDTSKLGKGAKISNKGKKSTKKKSSKKKGK